MTTIGSHSKMTQPSEDKNNPWMPIWHKWNRLIPKARAERRQNHIQFKVNLQVSKHVTQINLFKDNTNISSNMSYGHGNRGMHSQLMISLSSFHLWNSRGLSTLKYITVTNNTLQNHIQHPRTSKEKLTGLSKKSQNMSLKSTYS